MDLEFKPYCLFLASALLVEELAEIFIGTVTDNLLQIRSVSKRNYRMNQQNEQY